MANIRMRQGRYQAQVRRHGYRQATKTFTSITEAKKWVKATEIDMERQQFIPKISMTVREMLEKYEQICLPTHKGADLSLIHISEPTRRRGMWFCGVGWKK